MSHPSTSWTLVSASAAPTSGTGARTFTPGTDFLLNTDGDLDLSSNTIEFTQELQAVEQGVRLRVERFLGEWFLNGDLGVDYFGQILGQKFNAARIVNAFRGPILATPGVNSIPSITATYDGPTRSVSVSFEVLSDLGKLAADLQVSV